MNQRIRPSLDKPFNQPFAHAWVEIDLKALRHNFREACRLAHAGITPTMGQTMDMLAVVKADAYGHGMLAAVDVMRQEGCSFFAVSNINEALVLRSGFRDCRILMLEAVLPDCAQALVAADIRPALGSLELAKAVDREARRRGKLYPIHVKVDTGMGRLGVWHKNLPQFLTELLKLKNIFIEGFMTHFPLAEGDRTFTKNQAALFATLLAGMAKQEISFRFCHAANSMGLAGYKNSYFNLARPGIILYGLYPVARLRSRVDLQPVMSVKTRVLLVKTIYKGCGVSYGHIFKARKSLCTAVIGVGYSDGYRRSLAPQSYVLIKGKKCPVLGRITMDQVIVDVSRADNVVAGDEVVLIGSQGRASISMDDFASWADTIHYEIACNFGNRLPRKYIR